MAAKRLATAVLLISCPDREGIVAAVTRFLAEFHGNIIDLDQHVDRQEGVFFMRVVWDLSAFAVPLADFAEAFAAISETYQMTWSLHPSAEKVRAAIFVSKQDHCFYDLLARYAAGHGPIEPVLVISNHKDLAQASANFGLPYHHLPVTAANKVAQEAQQLKILAEAKIDLIILARYMQILSPQIVDAYPNQIINIHHSFLPAFPGAKPYHQAHQRGVKIIGATSHYVTADLDAGPIIEQDVVRITHKDSPRSLVHKGRDLEKIVLARAVESHIHHKILVYNNKTVVF